MDSIRLIIYDSPWRFLIPMQALDISRIAISAAVKGDSMQGQISPEDLHEWLNPSRQYDLQIESSDESCPIAMVQVRLVHMEQDHGRDQLILKFQPLRGLEDLEEYVSFRQSFRRDH